MMNKVWAFALGIAVLADNAQAKDYEWMDAQHVCAVENANWVKADGSAWGEWIDHSGSFFITFAGCDISEEDARRLNDTSFDPCSLKRSEFFDGSANADQISKARASTYQGMYVKGFTKDLWYAKSESFFPREVPNRSMHNSKIESDNATAMIGFNGEFRYSRLDQLEDGMDWAWFTLQAKCAPVFYPD